MSRARQRKCAQVLSRVMPWRRCDKQMNNQRTLFISPRALTMVSPPPVQMTMSAPIAERPAAGLHSAHHSKPSNPHAHAWVSSKTPSGVLHLQQTSNDRASSPSLFFTAMAPSSSTA